MIHQPIKSALIGLATGDALGVPVEFRSRETMRQFPVTDMVGFGTHYLPAGTWSDDSSLAFCLAEALCGAFSLETIGRNFVKWLHENYWTPRGRVFDIGITTRQAILNLSTGCKPELAGGFDEDENGNGSLMRILPLVFYIRDMPEEERYYHSKKVSSLTHGHIRSVIACFYYLEFARLLLDGMPKETIYRQLQITVPALLQKLTINPLEIRVFDRLLREDISLLKEKDIKSSGYVLHTLEASIWCILTTDTYKDAVLKAVNLGEDTDTTGAVTGGLAGLIYGMGQVPAEWVARLARIEDINDLCERLEDKYGSGMS